METPHLSPEKSNPTISVESREAAIERLKNELPIVPQAEKQAGAISVFVESKSFLGARDWVLAYGRPSEEQSTPVNTAQDPDKFADASDFLKRQDNVYRALTRHDGRWWDDSKVEAEVQNSLREVFSADVEAKNGEKRALDILNCSSVEISDEERNGLQRALQAVGNFTKGKIYDRLSGIALCDDSHFENHDLGAYQQSTGVFRLNMEAFREYADEDLPPRYMPYFKDGKNMAGEPVSALEITTAHELGHVMDISDLDEVDAHMISKENRSWNAFGGKTGDFSTFDTLPGWKSQVVEINDFVSKDKWRFDDTIGFEEREYPPTTYAYQNPSEDCGESFGIASMGGNMSNHPKRLKRLGEMVEHAKGDELGEHTVQVVKHDVAKFKPTKRLKAIALGAYWQPDVVLKNS